MRQLVLELGGLSAPILRATAFLLRDPRVACTVRMVSSPRELPRAGVLRLESGSMVRPLLTVLWGGDQAMSASSQTSLGLSQAVWFEENPNERWRRASAPLPSRSLYGTPAQDRPWVLVAPDMRVDPNALENATGLSNPQLHLLRPRQAARHRHSVYWWPSGKILGSLLGRVDAVVAPNGPLAWDARRVGAPHFELAAASGVPTELADRRLARLVPETLVRDGAFWQALVTQLLDDSFGSSWGTTHWLHLARDRSRVAPRGWRLKRKLRKLRRDPEAFVADSKLFKLMTSKGIVPEDVLTRWPRAKAASEADAHPLFDVAWYLAQLPEPLADDESPLSHYLRVGAAQGLTPHPLFDVRWYVSQLPQPLSRGESPLEHYLRVGASQGLSPHPLFDAASYRERVAAIPRTPVRSSTDT